MRRQRVAVLGSTGSIGVSTLDVIRRLPGRFEVTAIAAATSTERIVKQAREFSPRLVIVSDLDACRLARTRLGADSGVAWGPGALLDAATDPRTDIVVMAMSGTAGLLAVLAALERGKRVCIATKEILVGFGEHVMSAAYRHGAPVLPIDSELSAIHQCLAGRSATEVSRIVLTASGGPFRRSGPPARATLRQVLRHPTWRMGRKITVDSATMMNKGLEIIETCRLFGVNAEQVGAVVHPQSVVHALVEFRDGSVVAQLSHPDMRLPIQHALLWPERVQSPVRPLHLEEVARLEFEPLDPKRFPCLALAISALRAGGSAPCVLNTANQVAVDAFLAGRIEFGAIPAIINAVLDEHGRRRPVRRPGIRRLLADEAWAGGRARILTAAN